MATSNSNVSTPVPFPQPDAIPPQQNAPTTNPSPNSPTSPQRRSRTSTNASLASVASNRIRTAGQKLMETDPPPGMWAATGTAAAKAPTLGEIRRGSFSSTGWNEEVQKQRRASQTSGQSEEGAKALSRRGSAAQVATPESPARPAIGKSTRTGSSGIAPSIEPFPPLAEEDTTAVRIAEHAPVSEAPKYDRQEKESEVDPQSKQSSELAEHSREDGTRHGLLERQFSNGYIPPPKVPWTTSTVIALKAFWKWFLTIPGFLITLYGLNVVAWGGMLFLLLCNAAPAMCNPTCDDIQSPRRIWVEIDSQILNALFCVTGFGLAPWRMRDVYFWGKWRLGGAKHKQSGIRRLAGIHRGWFRLPRSDCLPADARATTVDPNDPAVPLPLEKIPDPPPTGIHAPPTKGWKMDFVVWMNMWNTFFQIVLCFYMWHYNRYDRPSWATGLFVALGCIVAGAGGLMMYHEGKYVKKVEGVPMPKGMENQRLDDIEVQSALTGPTQQEVPPPAAKS